MLNEDPTHEMDHWDVKMAFTVADPKTFGKVCKLQKSLYGLKQSAKNWQDLTRDIFREQKFFSLLSDPCVYFARKGEAFCVASTHVDDIFTIAPANAGVIKISQQAYVTELLQRHAPQLKSSTSHQKTPGGDYAPASEDAPSEVTDESLKKIFQSQIGVLWWLAGISRPDIFYAVHRCSKLQNRPNKKLGAHLQKIFSYLYDT